MGCMFIGGALGNAAGKVYIRKALNKDLEATRRILVSYHTWQARRAVEGDSNTGMSELFAQGSVVRELHSLSDDTRDKP